MIVLNPHQYKELVTMALDKQLAQLKGGFVLDEFDPAVEGDKIFRIRVERFVKRKNIAGLEKMLKNLIQYFQFKYDSEFASALFQLTGYKIVPIPSEQISISTRKNLRVGISGKESRCLTFVSIEVPTGSGSIYCVRRRHPEMTAEWLDTKTVEIQIPSVREEVEKVTSVRMYDETIRVLYKEID